MSRARLAGRSFRLVALVMAGAVLFGLGAWVIARDIPSTTKPRDDLRCAPLAIDFLDDETGAVAHAVAAAGESCDGRERRFYLALAQAMEQRHAAADDVAPWDRMTKFLREEAQAWWRDGRRIQMVGFDPWPVPRNPDWSENPYDDRTWARTYHSLGWLNAPAALYHSTGDARYVRDIRHYVLSWIRGNPSDDPPSQRSWFDGAVALRTDAIVAHLPLLLEVVEPTELGEIIRALHEHGRTLNGYLGDERWHGHNHNLFHALSLHNLATLVPELRGAEEWRENARNRIGSLLAEMVDEDGVSTEQAASYHYTAIRWFTIAERYLAARGIPFSDDEAARLTDMTRFGSLLPTPHGALPAIGDTSYRAVTPWELLEELDARGLAHPEAEYVLSRGARGTRPQDVTTFPASGYAILRPSYGDSGAWENDLHVVVDMGSYRRIHGHRDAMNVLVAAHGAVLIVDSGGPFAYGVPRRNDYLHAAAHNTVVVDGADFPEHGTASLDQALDDARYSVVEGSHSPADGVEHTRMVAVLKPDLTLVVDRLRSTGGHRTFELLWHLPHGADVTESSTGVTVTVDGASLGLAVETAASSRSRLRIGEPDSPVGWVTVRHRREREAPVFSVEQHGDTAWFVTAMRPAPLEEAGEPALSVEQDGDALNVRLDGGDGTWELRLRPGAAPAVHPPR